MRIFDADVTGSLHVSGSSELKGNLVVSGSQTITGSLTVDGNTKFGDQISDNHNFTGSVNISGSNTLTGTLIVTNGLSGSLDYSYLINTPTLVSGSSQITYSGLTGIPSNIISGSAQIYSLGFLTGYTDTFTTGSTFNTGDGVITFTKNDGGTYTVDIDGRFQPAGSYLTGYTETDTLSTVTARGNTTNQSITVSGVTSYNDVVISGGTLTVYESVSGATVFAVDGTNGRLFAVTDDLSNSLFSVNTISGLPVIEAFADYHIVMGRFNQNDFYLGTTGEIGVGSLPVSGYKLAVTGNVRATSFVKSGGTSSQFLKADGSVDSNTYLTAHPSVSAASSSNNSGRTYIQDILLDSYGHITGITTASETVTDTNNYTTGVTFNTGDGVLTFTRNDGNTYTVDLDGRYGSSSSDFYTTGATFNTSNGVITYTRNDGGTYTVDIDGRFLTSYSEISTLEDVVQRGNTSTISITAASFITQGGNHGEFVKGDGTLDSNTYLTAHPSVSAASSSNNSGRTYIQDILLDSFGHITGITTASETVTDTNYYVTGATFNTGDGVITLTRNDGNTITVDIDGRFLTAHPSVSAASSSDNSGRTYIQDILLDSFGHITGITTGTETVVDTNTNYYVTGATFNTGNGVITLTRNDGNTVTVDIDGKYSELGHTHDDRYLPYVKNVETLGLPDGRWYTIAVNTGSRAVGKFILRDTSSGNHQSVVFYATHHYGNYSDITVLINSRYSGNPFRYIRIQDGSTYDGALLQVYIDQSSSTVQAWMLENIQSSGWVIKDWVDEAVDPGDVSNFPALTETPAQVDLDQTPQGGMIVTGPIYGGGDITQYEYLNTNNYSTTTDTRYYTETEIANFFGGSVAITGYNKSNWDTAYGWGNHASQGYATTGYVQTQITNLIDGAPSALDTLNELAAALGDDANFATTIASSIGAKLPLSGGTMTGNIAFGATSNLGLTWGLNTDAAFIKFISTSNAAGGSYLEIGTQDDSDEEIKFTQSGNVRFYLATDGFLKNGSGYKYVYESGTWGIDISGNAATVTNGVYSNGSYSNPSWITALAGSKITGNISGNAYNITQYTINQDLGTSNSPTFNNVTATGVYGTNTSSTRNKYNVYSNSGTYAIGMESGNNFGGLADWAMTFQMNNDDDRGFWWGDDGHNTSQGAMSLTTNGYLTVARGVRVGYGESDTATPNVPLQVYGSGSLVFDVQGSQGQLFSITDSLSGSLFSVNDISGLPILEVFSDDKLVAGSFGTNAFVVSGTTTTVSGSLAVSGSATVNGGTVWHSGNDGSSSGLDADLLDGLHASSFLTAHPSVSAAGSSNNSGRTYIQDILLDSFGHITGITTASETVVDTDTNYYVTGATFNTSTGVITMTRNDGGTVTVDIDGKYAESSHTHSVIDDMTDEHRLFNNMGQNHSTYTDFNSVGDFGARYVNGSTNGPGTGSSQFYGFTLGLGNDYSFANYAMQLAIPRYNTSDRYVTFRTREATTWGSWYKIYAGYADTAGALSSMNISQFTNDSGYLTAHPSVSAAGSSNNSGRTYIQDILLDSFGHITGITTATETVVDTDTNYYVTGATFNTSNGIITLTRNDGGTVTVDIDGKYQEAGTYLGAINYNNDSNSTYQLLWGSGNSVYGTSGVYVNPSSDYVYGGSFVADSWFRSNNATGWYNATYGGGIYQTESTMVRVYDNRGFWIDGGNTNTVQDATLYVTATNNNDWLAQFNAYNSSKSEYGIYVNIAAGATYGYALRTDSSSFTYRVDGSGRVYAPIYYDINDTAYYLNPASTSNLATVKLNSTASGTEVFTVDGVNGRLFTITDDLSNSLFSVNTIAGVPVIEAFADNKVIMGRYNQNDFHLNTSGNIAMGASPVSGVKLFVNGNVSIGGANSGYTFYNNGTSYFNGSVYVDDNLTIAGGYALKGNYGTWTGEENKIQWHSNNLYFQNTGGGDFVFRNGGATNIVTITNAGALTATSLVKSGGTSAQFLMADGSVSTNPGWITSYVDTNNYTTGVTWNGSTAVLTFTRNNGDTYNVTMLESISDVTVTGGTYSAGTLTLTKSNGGTVTVTGFSVVTDTNTYVTGATFNTGNGVITMTRTDGGTVTVDIDGKYAEASHTHNYVSIDGVDRVGVLRFKGEGGDSGFATGDYPYGIFQEGGAWSHPYPDLKINFHTGIVLAAAASYGGIRFQRDYNDTTELMSVGNGDAHVRVANNLYMGGNLVATQSWVGSQGYLTAHPSVSAAGSSNNSGRTYIQDILLDSFGHITGITTATETVVDTDTNYYVNSASFNTSNGIITLTRNDGGTVTVDIDGKYAESAHTHDDRYFTETESDARFQPLENQRVSTSSTVRFSNIYSTAWFRNDNSNTGIYNETTTMHLSSQSNGFWDVSSTNSESSIRFYTGGHVSALRGYVYANSSNQIGFLNSGGNWGLRMDNSYNVQIFGALTVGSGTSSDIYMTDTDETTRRIHCNSGRIGFLNSSSNWGAWSDNTGNWHTDFAMYSPIYYDSNDTNYYLNPASTSNLKTVKVNSTVAGTEALTVDGVNGRLFTITDDMTDSIFSVNTISGLPVIEAFADYKVVMGRYNQNDFIINPSGQVSIGSTAQAAYKFTVIGGQWGSYFKGGDTGTGSDIARFVDNAGTTRFLVRGDGAVLKDGNTVWHGGNDGTGSGLDADLLDGQDGSYYAAASSLGSYLPLGGGTMTGTITITNTDIRSNATSNWTGDPGAQGKIQYHSNRWYIVADQDSNRIVQFRRNGTDVSYIDNSGVYQGSISGNAATATALTSMNISQFTNNSGYITGYSETDTLGTVTNRGSSTSQNITFSNGRKGLVGVYDAAQTQAIFAMGIDYILTDGGASGTIGNHYGLAWSYNPDYGGAGNNPQSKAGLNHQLLLMQAGVTTAAMGSGIWTSGNISAANFSGSSSGTNTGDQTNISGNAATVTINYNNDSNSTYQLLWGSGNSVYGTGGVYVNPSLDYVYATAFVSSKFGIQDGTPMDCYMEVGDGNPTEDGIGYGGTFHFYGDQSTASSHLYFGGANITYNLVVGGRITENSSIRYKKDIETLEGGLDKVLAMRGVTYIKKDTGIKEVGLIAEELAEILPEVVGFDTQGQPDSVSYSRITAILIEAIKDLKKEIDELKGKK